MNSSDDDNALRRSANEQPDDTRSKTSLTALNKGSVPDCRPDSVSTPVRIGREEVQKNIPPDPDTDDPVAP